MKQVYAKTNMLGLLQKLYTVDWGHLNSQCNWFSNECPQILSNAELNRLTFIASSSNVVVSHKILTN